MANWRVIIDANALWARQDELSPREFAQEFVSLLKGIQPQVVAKCGDHASNCLEDIIDDLGCSVDDESTFDDFDAVLRDFYDWADFNYVWLDTLNKPTTSAPLKLLRSVNAMAVRNGEPIITEQKP